MWIPIPEGSLNCVCCGNHASSELHPWCKKHAYCGVCWGRGRAADHTPEECATMPPSVPFRRMEHDCPGCGQRHQDWETCANQIWADYKAGKINEFREPIERPQP